MNQRPPHRVTRGYVLALIAADAIFACSVLIAAWGLLALTLDTNPVTSDVSMAAAPVIILVAVALLVWSLWVQALEILRGRRTIQWTQAVILAGSSYLVWCLGGIATGMSVNETWLSPFALILAIVWGLASVPLWLILFRRLYSDRGRPLWPWEKKPNGDGPENRTL